MTTSTLRERRTGAGEDAYSPLPSDAQLDLLADFRSELQQLSANQRELLDELRSDAGINLDAEELPRLRQENDEPRARVEQLERSLRIAPPGDDTWVERQTEYERLLDEKSEVIRSLHLKIQQLQQSNTGEGGATAVPDATMARLKQDLEARRQQLEEDEANLMQQMRTMEMALAKDRAELARQRIELQRQQSDFAREVELASRDPELRDRLASLRPRQQESPARKPVEPSAPAPAAPSIKTSGLIRRLFG